MLAKIYIQNFALIDELEVSLDQGLQVITGETGAGKSIILGALRLIMGERADTKSIADPSRKSIVEGIFNITKEKFNAFFEEHDLDFEEETLVRRELTANGKSRAFINDTPVTLGVLKDFTDRLIDIHSQFETSRLFNEDYQFGILDGISKNEIILEQYQQKYKTYTEATTKLKQLEKRLIEGNKEADYHQYLLQELEEANLDNIDIEQLKADLSTQENAEAIIEQLSQCYQLFTQDSMGVLEILNEAKSKLGKISEFSPDYEQLSERLNSLYFEMKDISDSCGNELENVQIDPEILQNLNAQLNIINTLLIKHQAQTVEELIGIREKLSEEHHLTENLEHIIQEQKEVIAKITQELTAKSNQLTENRKKAAKIFIEKSSVILKRLGLENARLEVALSEADVFNIFGKNRVELMFQANSGYDLKPIKHAVSGGERSRVMFAVKKIVAESNDLPTLILDEIDTGISGRVAEEMGHLMKEMGNDIQLIVITHLAQIAAKGNSHYKVQKAEVQGKTQSDIFKLNADQQLQEVAQLLSGSKVTEAALQQAKELMN
ncbi:DNA repair protein RecN [Elizabethkingia sp. JS20170427COW]|uniref:DNA repair protein RecN n=1 Tax=Elizabethkingia sp. JS20170427COW TaxID=2583851 RepID=UPI001110B435|nr:DNA repair protein RecN [Elizabethkingia sp. JS20170427COW]QCX53206.1 DNA repair protein RecN [Elizabethkingia sp. JS20170427COW]